jgi:hypothetical protein
VATFNTIIVGYPWSQVVSFPAGAVAVDETLRASFRRNSASPQIFELVEPADIVRTGNDFDLQLDAVRSALIIDTDKVSFDLYADKAGSSRPLQLRIHVPVREGL